MQEAANSIRFDRFELDPETGELKKDGVPVRLAPQPARLLLLLASHAGRLVSRDEIRKALWGEETFVDFTQGVNFSIKLIREALGDAADQPKYIQTVPKRGYKFIAAVTGGPQAGARGTSTVRRIPTDVNLHKALWANIAEMRLAEQRRRRLTLMVILLIALAGTILAIRRLL